MERVVYYTSAYFMDISLEVINAIKNKVALHVFIEITPNSKNANIIDIEKYPAGKYIATPEEVLSERQQCRFKDYFDGCRSVYFILHRDGLNSIGSIWRTGNAVKKLIRQYNPSVYHFEAFSLRTISLLPLLLGKAKVLLAIHDGVIHSGEAHLKSILQRLLFIRLPYKKTLVFYSRFTRDEFFREMPSFKNHAFGILKIHSYTFFERLFDRADSDHKHILFFGRISRYKGVPLLLDAMEDVWKDFPETNLIIAGKGDDPEVLNHRLIRQGDSRVTFINRHIPNGELVKLIGQSKMVVCPYTDASQSGVLWTTFGIKKPVVATNVGAFSEFIKPGYNGLLAEKTDAASIASAIKDCLRDDRYLAFEKNIQQEVSGNADQINGELLLKLYKIS